MSAMRRHRRPEVFVLVLQYYRLKHGWSQSALAILAQTNQPIISLIETGRLIPSDKQLEGLAVALGVWPPSMLMRTVSVDGGEQNS